VESGIYQNGMWHIPDSSQQPEWKVGYAIMESSIYQSGK
jgi:hypothetical protein